MDRKQLEEREALKEAVESLDAPPTVPPDGVVAPDLITESENVAETPPKTCAPALSQEEIDRLTAEIVVALKSVYDPEIPADIYELGLIYKVAIDDGRNVEIDMTLTAPGCPVAGDMPGWVENAVSSVPGVQNVTCKIVFDPPWDHSRMSEEARMAMNMW